MSKGSPNTLVWPCCRFCRVYTRYIAADRTVKGGSCCHVDNGHSFILGISFLETSLQKRSVMIAMRMSVHHDCD